MNGLFPSQFEDRSDRPLYRQVADQIRSSIRSGILRDGDRLPATRELAGELGLNRTTISAAYALLESEGLIKGEVGRGSFVHYDTALVPAPPQSSELISFASSRPAEDQFPIAEFQATCQEIIQSAEISHILQLGSPAGYAPLRQYLLAEARSAGTANGDDDILITSGCQQALDILQRTLAGPADTVVVEDPVYHGLKNVFQRSGIRLIGVPLGSTGLDVEHLGRVLLNERPRMLILTPNFQNPTGITLPLASREAIAKLCAHSGVLLVENNIYADLRYEGAPLPSIKQLGNANNILLGSFSKIAFPGLRVGWAIGPRALIAKMAETRQWCDLHSDQLSQAILLRFAQSGRLEQHRDRVRIAGAARLKAVIGACERHLPQGTEFTRPEGGMSLWVRLPDPLDAAGLLPRAEREHVNYLPGAYFAIGQPDARALRISFGGLAPEQIEKGIATLGGVCRDELERLRTQRTFEAAPAMV